MGSPLLPGIPAPTLSSPGSEKVTLGGPGSSGKGALRVTEGRQPFSPGLSPQPSAGERGCSGPLRPLDVPQGAASCPQTFSGPVLWREPLTPIPQHAPLSQCARGLTGDSPHWGVHGPHVRGSEVPSVMPRWPCGVWDRMGAYWLFAALSEVGSSVCRHVACWVGSVPGPPAPAEPLQSPHSWRV